MTHAQKGDEPLQSLLGADPDAIVHSFRDAFEDWANQLRRDARHLARDQMYGGYFRSLAVHQYRTSANILILANQPTGQGADAYPKIRLFELVNEIFDEGNFR